jgi:hypothetical protein
MIDPAALRWRAAVDWQTGKRGSPIANATSTNPTPASRTFNIVELV